MFYSMILLHLGTIQRFCESNGTWAKTVPPEIQCHICVGEGRPVKVSHSFTDRMKMFLFSLIQSVL